MSRVKAAGDLRKAHAAEQLTTVITTRRLLALRARLGPWLNGDAKRPACGQCPPVVSRVERGNDFQRAMAVCILNKVPDEDRKVISETFDHHVGPLASS